MTTAGSAATGTLPLTGPPGYLGLASWLALAMLALGTLLVGFGRRPLWLAPLTRWSFLVP